MSKMSAIEGWVVVLLNKIVEKRCAGLAGWERQACLNDMKHHIFDWNNRHSCLSFFNALYYLYKQLQLQEDIHDSVIVHDNIIKSLDVLERLGYQNEKIKRIQREFDKSLSERNCDAALKEYLEQVLSDP